MRKCCAAAEHIVGWMELYYSHATRTNAALDWVRNSDMREEDKRDLCRLLLFGTPPTGGIDG
jgi:hypothetical protein